MVNESPTVARLKTENEELKELLACLADAVLEKEHGRYSGLYSTRVNEATGRA